MNNKTLKLILDSQSIIIARHRNPDLDAYGSQFGLYYALKSHFLDKKIYVIGDTNSLNYFKEFDEVDEEPANNSLLIILDTVSKQMLDPGTYKNYKQLVLIDHHRNEPDIKHDIIYKDVEASSTAEIIADLLVSWNIEINYKSARALYLGIIGDTGRFMYNNTTAKTLSIASILLSKGLNIQDLHNSIYLEPKRNKEIKNIFFNRVKYTDKNIAYAKNDSEFIKDNDLNINYVSRGLVNQMAGMIEVPIWVNFTENEETNEIYCEIRSRDIIVLDVAKKYDGGGHLNACGCTLNSWDETDRLLDDLNNLVKEN